MARIASVFTVTSQRYKQATLLFPLHTPAMKPPCTHWSESANHRRRECSGMSQTACSAFDPSHYPVIRIPQPRGQMPLPCTVRPCITSDETALCESELYSQVRSTIFNNCRSTWESSTSAPVVNQAGHASRSCSGCLVNRGHVTNSVEMV